MVDPDEEDRVVSVRCLYCWSPPGEWCRTTGGHRTVALHKRRWRSFRDRDAVLDAELRAALDADARERVPSNAIRSSSDGELPGRTT